MTGDIVAYLDDIRVIRHSLEHNWATSHRSASKLENLRIHEATRKRRIDNGS